MPEVLPTYLTVVAALERPLCGLPGYVIAIDGRDGVGKTTLGRYLAWHFNISLIETDLFLVPDRSCLDYRYAEIRQLIQTRLSRPRPVIVDAVAALRLLQNVDITPDFIVYVQNKAISGSLGLSNELSAYEKAFGPQAKANLVITIESEY